VTRSKTFIVIPTYQELANLPGLIASIHEVVPEAVVVIVDDDSGDGTPGWAGSHPEYGRKLFLLERREKAGLGSALRDGHGFAMLKGADIILQMDADFSHDPADLPRLIEAVRQGAALAVGSRYCHGGDIRHWAYWRRVLSRTAGVYVRFWTGLPLSDPTAGLRAFSRAALESVEATPACCDGYAFQIEMALAVWREGGVMRELPVTFTERREGCSKLSMRIVAEAIIQVPRMRGLSRHQRGAPAAEPGLAFESNEG